MTITQCIPGILRRPATFLLPLLMLAVIGLPRSGQAAPCTAKSLSDINHHIKTITTDPSACADLSGFPTIRIVSPDGGSTISLDSPLVVTVPVHILSTGNTQLISNFTTEADKAGCLITLARDNIILEKVMVNNVKARPAKQVLCTAPDTKNITIKDSIITTDADAVTGIALAGLQQIVIGSTLTLTDGTGISITGDRARVEKNTITVPTGVGVDITGLDPKVYVNRIFSTSGLALKFSDTPKLKKSDAANIAMLNESFILQADGTAGQGMIPARSNFVGLYNDVAPFPKCPILGAASLPFKPALDTLECSVDLGKLLALLQSDKESPPATTCPEGTALKDGSCVAAALTEPPKDKELDTKLPDTGKSFTVPDFKPLVANPATNNEGCTLIPNKAASALTPVAVFLVIIAVSGVGAYRVHLKTRPIRHDRRNDKKETL